MLSKQKVTRLISFSPLEISVKWFHELEWIDFLFASFAPSVEREAETVEIMRMNKSRDML